LKVVQGHVKVIGIAAVRKAIYDFLLVSDGHETLKPETETRRL